MATPWKDLKTGVWHLRQKTPRDLLDRLRGATFKIPIGDGTEATLKLGEIVKVSLRTKDDRVAKQRYAAANAALQAVWEQARSPSPLMDVTPHRASPIVASTGPAGGMSWETAVQRFGPSTQALLADLNEQPTDANQAAVISATAGIMDEAFAMLHRDKFGEAPPVSQKPSVGLAVRPGQGAAAPAPHHSPITVAELWKRYRAYHGDKRATNTLHRYGASIARFAAYFPARDVRSFSGDDVHAWAVHRRDVENIHPRTINTLQYGNEHRARAEGLGTRLADRASELRLMRVPANRRRRARAK